MIGFGMRGGGWADRWPISQLERNVPRRARLVFARGDGGVEWDGVEGDRGQWDKGS